MKWIYSTLVVALLTLMIFNNKAFSQAEMARDTSWKFTFNGALNFSQASFTNWAAGGDNSIAIIGTTLFGLVHDGKKNKWENFLKAAYGWSRIAGVDRKNEDEIQFGTRYGIKTGEKMMVSGFFNFRSQFDKGFEFIEDTAILVSKFLSPAFISAGAGLDYRPSEHFSFLFTPVTVRWTLVNDTARVEHTRYGVDANKKSRFEFGAQLNAGMNVDLAKNVNLVTSLRLFSNYVENPQNVDVLWDLLLNLQVNEWLAASVTTQLIYDDDILVPKQGDSGTYLGKGTQFKQILAIGMVYVVK